QTGSGTLTLGTRSLLPTDTGAKSMTVAGGAGVKVTGDATLRTAGDFSIVAWFVLPRPTRFDRNTNLVSLRTAGDNSESHGWLLTPNHSLRDNPTWQTNFERFLPSFGLESAFGDSLIPSGPMPYMLAGVVDGTNGVIRVYVNGVEAATDTIQGTYVAG